MTTDPFIAIATVATIAAVGIMSPGPDFLAVSTTAVTGTRRQASVVAAGVVLGNAAWAGAALVGVGTLFALFPTFYLLFKVAGAAYILWLGAQLLRHAKEPLPPAGSVSSSGLYRAFARGLSTTMANPKAAVYYASALSTAAPPDASWALLLAMLFAVFLVASVWFAVVVLVLTQAKPAALFRRFKTGFESVFGVLLMAFGLRQLLGAFNAGASVAR